MTSQDDPDNIYFEATFQFIKGPYTCRETRRRSGPGGQTSLALEDVRIKFISTECLAEESYLFFIF